MIAEVLSRNVTHLVTNGRLQGFKAASTLPHSNIQQFMDDTFLFGKSSVMEAKGWKILLADYAKASRQCINYEKSNLFFFNTQMTSNSEFSPSSDARRQLFRGPTWASPSRSRKSPPPSGTLFWNRCRKILRDGKVNSSVVRGSSSFSQSPYREFWCTSFPCLKYQGPWGKNLRKSKKPSYGLAWKRKNALLWSIGILFVYPNQCEVWV